jgi:hypothetical protein
MSDSAPDARTLAEELGVDGELLVAFARSHPDPTVDAVIAWADADADTIDRETKEDIGVFLAARGSRWEADT